jgi:glutaredoxin
MLKPHVIVYSRPGCHLCDEAKAAIQSAGGNESFTLEEINIESDNELLRKYKHDIPVVTIDGVEAFRHRIDVNRFKKFINPSTAYTESV